MPFVKLNSFWCEFFPEKLTFFRAWGDPVQNRPQNAAPAGCLFSTRKSRSEVPERGDFGEEIAWGRVGRTGQKRKKDAQKMVGISHLANQIVQKILGKALDDSLLLEDCFGEISLHPLRSRGWTIPKPLVLQWHHIPSKCCVL